MKKNYLVPKMKTVRLEHRAKLLENSDGYYHGGGSFNLPVEPPTDAKA